MSNITEIINSTNINNNNNNDKEYYLLLCFIPILIWLMLVQYKHMTKNIKVVNKKILLEEIVIINNTLVCIICYENVNISYKLCDIKTDHYYCYSCFEKIKNEYNMCVICKTNNKTIKYIKL